ncbi:hypothetical protein AYO47_03905 [Planctomyces sp. SCGC AG-212-M04]|nr:hypothetical protein AYO47_03905 [Planctomyces sp. SCGC AG-212-M04]
MSGEDVRDWHEQHFAVTRKRHARIIEFLKSGTKSLSQISNQIGLTTEATLRLVQRLVREKKVCEITGDSDWIRYFKLA